MEKNNWSEISKEVSDVTKKIKNKVDNEDLVDDLKDSLKDTIENTSELFKNILSSIESTIKDEQIKSETKDIVEKINNELLVSFRQVGKKVSDLYDSETAAEEE
jgi:predicted  nucleic acid-binding Zn-ribbon protein|tara:strand:+ start:4538 stop:4849 length:312 start_codon:yes stop_codon:yes gene_type:complete